MAFEEIQILAEIRAMYKLVRKRGYLDGMRMAATWLAEEKGQADLANALKQYARRLEVEDPQSEKSGSKRPFPPGFLEGWFP